MGGETKQTPEVCCWENKLFTCCLGPKRRTKPDWRPPPHFRLFTTSETTGLWNVWLFIVRFLCCPFQLMFSWLLPPCLNFVSKYCRQFVRCSSMHLTMSTLTLYSCMIQDVK